MPTLTLDHPLSATVASAAAGDAGAWERIVARFERMLREIGRRHRLVPADVDDAIQVTWLQLVPRLSTLRDPAALPGWLGTTMRRECLRALAPVGREVAFADEPVVEEDPLEDLESQELRAAFRAALASLPARHRELMTLLVAEPQLSYAAVSARLGIPIGSIGPIRARCLDRLARDERLRAFQ